MNFSISEILVILVIALLVIKPQQLPEVARALGRLARVVRQFFVNIKADMHKFVGPIEQPNEKEQQP